MAISLVQRSVKSFSPAGSDGKPTSTTYLDYIDDSGTVVASLVVPADGSSPYFSVDDANVQTVYSASVTLTDAQIKALPTTGITILAAQGANTIIFPVEAVLRMEWVADYTNIAAGATIDVKVGAESILVAFRESLNSRVTSLLAGGGPDGTLGFTGRYFETREQGEPSPIVLGGHAGAYDSDLANLPLKILATNDLLGNFTGGDVGNALTVDVGYRLLTF